MSHNLFESLQQFQYGGKSGRYYSLAALEKAGLGKVSRLPRSLRVVLESALRNYDGLKITEAHLKNLAGWKPNAKRTEEVPFVVARVLLQDMTGRSARRRFRGDARSGESARQEPGDHRTALPCPSHHRPFGSGRSTTARRTRCARTWKSSSRAIASATSS